VAGTCRVAAPTNYTVGVSPQAFINACSLAGHTTVLPAVDDATALLTVPFTYYLWDYNGTAAWVSSNGVFGGGSVGTTAYTESCPLGTSAPANAVLAFWDDQVTRTGVCAGTSGTAPNRKFVVTWSDSQSYIDSTAHLTYSVIISEGSNIIDVVYQTMTGTYASGISAGVGITNTGSTRTVQYSCDSASISSGTAIRFTPM
jgi:hypothetical protein